MQRARVAVRGGHGVSFFPMGNVDSKKLTPKLRIFVCMLTRNDVTRFRIESMPALSSRVNSPAHDSRDFRTCSSVERAACVPSTPIALVGTRRPLVHGINSAVSVTHALPKQCLHCSAPCSPAFPALTRRRALPTPIPSARCLSWAAKRKRRTTGTGSGKRTAGRASN